MVLRALEAPRRLAMLVELADGRRCVPELVDVLDIFQPLASQHLRVRRTAGLVSGRRRGQETAYVLNDGAVARIARDAVSRAGRPGCSSTPPGQVRA
jgi:DNA-binding transcriptional ArsR family regulator